MAKDPEESRGPVVGADRSEDDDADAFAEMATGCEGGGPKAKESEDEDDAEDDG